MHAIGLLLSCPVLHCVSSSVFVRCESPKTKTWLGKTEAAVTRLRNKPNIQIFRFRSVRGHVFPCVSLSLGRSKGSSGLNGRHISSHPSPSFQSKIYQNYCLVLIWLRVVWMVLILLVSSFSLSFCPVWVFFKYLQVQSVVLTFVYL